MPNVSAPYNFVPLNEEVFFPPWADLVSHDVPFKEGISGKIKLKITAETPIFIRKPYEEGDEEGDEEGSYFEQDGKIISKEFCHIKNKDRSKKYYIPGSSIRNMLRSVIEIMSFSKLSFVSDKLNQKKAYRDMANRNLYNVAGDGRIRIGWLVEEDGEILIKDVGRLGSSGSRNRRLQDLYADRIIERPHNYYNRNLDFFEKLTENQYNEFINPNTSLQRKYEIYNNPNNNYRNGYKESAATLGIYNDNDFHDVIVITGNINGKRNEFIFDKPSEENEEYEINKITFNDFTKANSENSNWYFWKLKFNEGFPVPVFFRLGENNEVRDFGLTVLYKMLYKNSVIDLIRNQQQAFDDAKQDLVETMFGHINNDKLKGRITVKHAFSENAQTSNREYEFILSGPKETFYPFYIKQDVNNNTLINGLYKTYNEGAISGRKRYPVHNRFAPNEIESGDQPENDNVKTKFIPLNNGTEFSTEIVYHNLLPEELGALLSAIKFHGHTDRRHNIGLAKPFGFGKIKVDIIDMERDKIEKYLCQFEKMMDDFISKEYENNDNWIDMKEIKELFAMALSYNGQDRRKLKYMRLVDFHRVKTENKALPSYSDFMNINSNLTSKIEGDCNNSQIIKITNSLKY